MPQGQRKYSDFNEVTSSQPKAPKYGDFNEVTRPLAPQPQDTNSLLQNAWEAAKNAGRNYIEKPIITLGEAIESAQNGDWGPLKNIAGATGRGALKIVDSISAAQTANPETAEIQTPAIQQLAQERLQNSPTLQDIQKRNVQYDEFTKRNPSKTAKVVRGATGVVTGAAPVVATGLATGGSVPAMAGVAALQSMGEPESLPMNVALTALPAPALRNIRSGRSSPTQPQLLTTAKAAGAKPIKAADDLLPPVLEPVEALPTLSARASTAGPRAAFDAELESIPMESLFRDASASTPSLGKAIGKGFGTTSQAMRTLWTSMDMSSPLSQGAILSIAHPVKAARSFKMMFKSLSKKQSEAIDSEILNNPLLQLGEDHGLYVATSAKLKGQPEEFFALEALNKLPGIRHSERTFRTYLDTLRLSTWESYVKALERGGLTPQANPRAYQQAAEFINIATGRGVLEPGGKLAKAMDLGGDLLFAPRNLIANFQLLDPIRYATLSPGARKVVLRDATTAFGAMLGTAALLRLAGGRVGFDPEAEDFMQARIGDTRYDLTFGKKTQVQFLARALAGTYRQATGAGNLPGKDPLSVIERFGRSKLAPLPGLAYTGLAGRDFKGESLADKSTGEIIMETAAPLLWRDLAEAYEEEGAIGVAKSSPAFFGARVSTYPDRAKPAWIETPETLSAERERLGMTRSYLEPDKDETLSAFESRKAKIEGLIETYAPAFLDSPQYRNATPDAQRAAIGLLNRRAKAIDEGKEWEAGAKLSASSIFDSIRKEKR